MVLIPLSRERGINTCLSSQAVALWWEMRITGRWKGDQRHATGDTVVRVFSVVRALASGYLPADVVAI